MKIALVLFTVCALILTEPVVISARPTTPESPQGRGMSIDDVMNLLNSGAQPDTVATLIQQTNSDFNLSLSDLEGLRRAGVPEAVLDAMLRARRSRPAGRSSNRPMPEPTNNGGPPPPTDINPGAGNSSAGAGSGNRPAANNGTSEDANSSVAPHNKRRLQQARAVAIKTDTPKPSMGDACTGAKRKVTLDYQNGKGSSSHLDGSGKHCFYLIDYNPLFDYSINPEVTSPTGNPLDLLNDAISILKNLGTGGEGEEPEAGAAAPAGGTKARPTPNPSNLAGCDQATARTLADNLEKALANVSVKATKLQAALTAMIPKDSGGKIIYVSAKTTFDAWGEAQVAYGKFEQALQTLQYQLPDPNTADACERTLLNETDTLAQAESILLDDYPELQRKFVELAKKLNTPVIPSVETKIDATDTVDAKVITTYAGAPVETKIFHFDPSFGILSSSAGFLITSLPARAYSSVTAPNPADPTQTQNVLSIENGRGVRPALTVLLTGNLPQLNRRNFGLGFSAGPVFDISSGKADTSRFGFFTGPSVRVTPWIFLTPGFHFGEFADFPQGFTRAGQVIPDDTGVPPPVKRFTGRFAFAVTFKLKDLGQAITSGDAKP